MVLYLYKRQPKIKELGSSHKYRSIYVKVFLALSGLAIWRIPSLFYLDELWQAPVFTPEAWMAMLGLFVAGITLGFLRPHKWLQLALLLGIGPTLHTLTTYTGDSLVLLWITANLMTLLIGILPVLGGAWVGSKLSSLEFRTWVW